METFLQAETLVIELLLIVSLVTVGVRRLQVPYTVALVLAGLLITLQTPLEISLVPELILALVVPPLVFEAAFHIDIEEIQRNLPHLLMLTVPGVILSTLVVGGLVSLATPLALPGGAGLWRVDRSDGPGLGGGRLSQVGGAPAALRVGGERELVVLFSSWEYVAFLANSLVFLLIGLKGDIGALVARGS